MPASLVFIGCEAAPENILQEDLPVVEEPTIPENPKDTFVGKGFMKKKVVI